MQYLNLLSCLILFIVGFWVIDAAKCPSFKEFKRADLLTHSRLLLTVIIVFMSVAVGLRDLIRISGLDLGMSSLSNSFSSRTFHSSFFFVAALLVLIQQLLINKKGE